jgi:hypothetical protein
MFLMCQFCGNAYTSPPRNLGDICGVDDCAGILIAHPYVKAAAPQQNVVMLKCYECGNVYSCPPRKIWDLCGANDCTGRLERA